MYQAWYSWDTTQTQEVNQSTPYLVLHQRVQKTKIDPGHYGKTEVLYMSEVLFQEGQLPHITMRFPSLIRKS